MTVVLRMCTIIYKGIVPKKRALLLTTNDGLGMGAVIKKVMFLRICTVMNKDSGTGDVGSYQQR